MSRLEKLSPLGWAETILARMEAMHKDIAKLTREVAELRTEVRALNKAFEELSEPGGKTAHRQRLS